MRRTRSVGTKLSDEEYAQLESLAAAQGVTPGECVRELVLAAFGKPAAGRSVPAKPAAEATVAEQTVLSEVLAVRTILINLIYDLAAGVAQRSNPRFLVLMPQLGTQIEDSGKSTALKPETERRR